MMKRSRGRHVMARWPVAAVLLGLGNAQAVDCTVNVLATYQTAVQRAWGFACPAADDAPGYQAVQRNFVTYPPDKIGCVLKTPPVWTGSKGPGRAALFTRSSGAPPDLKNGWRVKGFEVQGVQWEPSSKSPQARVQFRVKGTQAGHTYNASLSKLVLSKDGGTCSKAIDEAF